MDGVEQVAHAADAAGLVGDQLATATDQQTQLGEGVVLERDRSEVAGALCNDNCDDRLATISLSGFW